MLPTPRGKKLCKSEVEKKEKMYLGFSSKEIVL